ncbi:MAG: hypothetical protein M1423_02055 [Acidobacteria bacterium]|nr:hypothetical protein [Acidobacteriota bacterium]
MKRRDFARTALLGMGGTTLLSGSTARAIAGEVPEGSHQAVPGGQSAGLSVQVGQTVEITHSFRRCWFPTVH